ncbi:hypothetical protein BH23VER1_BH23VER1_06700 [soil metagenome]
MPETSPHPPEKAEPSPVEVRCYFVRGRNALAVRADFGPIYMDHYLHLMQHGIHLPPAHDRMLRDAFAALTLHLASRPWKETIAWTANFQEPALNLFVTGSSLAGYVTGRVFTENVKESEQALLYSQTSVKNESPRQSIIALEGTDLLAVAESFYLQSEQRPARFFHYAPEDLVFISAQPDCDLQWLDSLDDDAIQRLDQDEELSLLETRSYRLDCGCSLDRLVPALASLSSSDYDALFAGKDASSALDITCPRCAATFHVTRDQLRR